MKKVGLLICLLAECIAISYSQTDLSVVNLKCEYEINPIGIETKQPRLSWQLKASLRNQLQSAYQILVADSPDQLATDKGNIWDSKKVKSDQSIQIEYKGVPLQSAKKYFWKVKIWNQSEVASNWSDISSWQMGLMTPADWENARWISMPELDESKYAGMDKKAIHEKTKNLLPQFRKSFEVTKSIKNATAFISGLGNFDLHLNGQKVGDHFLDPGWTNYEKYVYYITFNITNLLAKNSNVVGMMLGNGFYNVPPGRYRKADLVTMHGLPKMICKVLIEYEDGTSQVINSDSTWKVTRSPITYGTVYGGEDYDATMEKEGWDNVGFNDSGWQQAAIVKGNNDLRSQRIDPNKIMEILKPVKIFITQQGKWVYDLGQNASGIVQLAVQGKTGKIVRVVPGELLDIDGAVTQRATGSPYYFTYKLKGKGIETWQPQFSYYGFRYVQLEGGVPEGQMNPDSLPVVKALTGLHTRNSAERIGNFWCSNELFNKTYTLINWGIKSNMASVITDCPHREKLGWLEQTHLMGASIQYNYDIARTFTKTINDMKSCQLDNGLVPSIAPEYCIFNDRNGQPNMFRTSPEWGSAYIILPWYMYQWYGDQRLLAENYDGMKKYMEYLEEKANNNDIISFGLGDWYDLGPQHPGPSQLTSLGVTGTATWYYDVNIMTNIAKLLGKKDDVAKYSKLSKEIKNAFNQTYFKKDSFLYDRNSQTANAMAIYMGLVEPQNKDKVLNSLVKDIRGRNNALTAGDIGYRYVLRVLEDAGKSDVIFDMNSRTDVPGYGYQIKQGATALTESWQALRNVSNNHLMLGHLMEWFYSGLAGIGQEDNSVAYKNIVIKPEIVGDINEAKASFMSPYGIIKSEWKKQGGTFGLNVEIPANTAATIYLPVIGKALVSESGKPIGKDIQFLRKENGRLLYKVGSGVYSFQVE